MTDRSHTTPSNEKKIKGPFDGPSNTSHPSNPSNNEERNQLQFYTGDLFKNEETQKYRKLRIRLQFYIWNPFKKNWDQKKSSPKYWNRLQFTWKILHNLIGPRKKITREFPLNLIWFHFPGKSFVFFLTFRSISKKSNLEGVFQFFYSDPQLDQNIKPTRNLCGQLLYIYLCIYMFSV